MKKEKISPCKNCGKETYNTQPEFTGFCSRKCHVGMITIKEKIDSGTFILKKRKTDSDGWVVTFQLNKKVKLPLPTMFQPLVKNYLKQRLSQEIVNALKKNIPKEYNDD